VSVGNRAGIPDIIVCDPKRGFIGIEVKREGEEPTQLQLYNLEQIRQAGGMAFCAHSLQEVKAELNRLEEI
jgi:hypothetical protein